MTASPSFEDDHVLAHQFIRLFGRRPSPSELERYRAAQARVRYRMRSRTRRRLARLISRM
jgi:hypothetical protein